MNTAESICADCGKKGDDVKNVCNKCNQVKYCNAACKKKHRHKHKKDCEEHLRQITEKYDEELFKQPPPNEDCPICFLLLPSPSTGSVYKSCCGKYVCSGCDYAVSKVKVDEDKKCPFCRTPNSTSCEELNDREKKRAAANDAEAIYNIGCNYDKGANGFPLDYSKAVELWHRAGELGCAKALHNIGCSYEFGEGVEVDKKKAQHYYQLAAMRGDEMSRHNLGCVEKKVGNVDRALKHFMIAVEGGESSSLEEVRELYSKGHATKEDYTTALRLYQAYLGEIKSVHRDEAAAFNENNRYY